MFLVKILIGLFLTLVTITSYSLYFGGDSKQTYLDIHAENQLLIESNADLSKQNNLLELEIQSKQQNDMHAEKFAREQLNLIYKDEDFLSFETKKPNAPQ
ncbi:MAG: septum formation initiator family protein [Proteobacteria bacterium]|nr:septum formation initiator family protein [Pseudomonadota bacterium]